MLKRIAAGAGCLLLALLLVLVGRGCLLPSALWEEAPVVVEVDEAAIARRLSEAIRFRTISPAPPARADLAPFRQYLAWVEAAYPRVHHSLSKELVSGASLLFTWEGTDPRAAPILLTAHYDVVPVNEGTEGDWEHPPFSGAIADGFVWGRGALDDKGSMIAILEAVTLLLEQGFRPRQTVYLAFGHDEELGGREGAGTITELLRSRGVQLAWSLDEGSFVVEDALPGVELPLAAINVAEKGYLTVELAVKGAGGHSSMPPQEPAVTILAAALVRLGRAPLPGGITGLTAQSLDAAASAMPLYLRSLFANRWLFGDLIEDQLSARSVTNALLRTTTAPTMLHASTKENVLPGEVMAVVNFRLHPRDTVEGVLEHVKAAVSDERVEIRVRGEPNEASEVSSAGGPGFAAIARATAQVYGPVAAMPGLTVGGTDSKHYGQIADDAYRFIPMKVTLDVTRAFHGTNERLSVDSLAQGTRAYVQILRNASAGEEKPSP